MAHLACLSRFAYFAREHWMLAVAALVALASMILVPPDEAYLGYFDWKTIGCLFCVLAVASAFRRIGTFDRIARMAIARNGHPRTLALALVLTTAAFSMAFTNDVALVVMLPLSAAVLVELEQTHLVPAVFALQALAANLCGMVTPFGNPQNLYLYSYFHLGLGEFLGVMIAPFLLSLLGVVATTWLMTGKAVDAKATARKMAGAETTAESTAEMATAETTAGSTEETTAAEATTAVAAAKTTTAEATPAKRTVLNMPIDRRRLTAYGFLFAIALLAVFRVVPFIVAVVIVAVVLAIADRKALAEVDYALLATFLCFFVFAGNMARIPMLGDALGPLMSQWGLLVSAGTSQVISNVPAAVVLSHFTESWQPLLMGVNIGGAGTFVGSLASLIAIRYFTLARKVFPRLRTPDSPTTGQFLRLFGLLNVAFFIVLLVFCQLLIEVF